MRSLLLSVLFTLGVALAGTTTASAAVGANIRHAEDANSIIEQVYYRCHSVRVCSYGRCYYRRVCRHYY